MPQRQSNNPKRRIADPGSLSPEEQERLMLATRYVGSALHKRRPADYGFHPPTNPRPTKSLCDDLRPLLKTEALALFAAGVRKGLVSMAPRGELPKYVWAVDCDGEVYEAKRDAEGYHGYRLDRDVERHQRECVLAAWGA